MLTAAYSCQVAWGLAAYMIEFDGKCKFLVVWMAGVAFFFAQVWILAKFVQNHENHRLVDPQWFPGDEHAHAAKGKAW